MARNDVRVPGRVETAEACPLTEGDTMVTTASLAGRGRGGTAG